MASITTDIVDAYVFRHRQGRAQFLLLRRHPELALGNTWHGVHGRVSEGETSLEAAKRAVRIQTVFESRRVLGRLHQSVLRSRNGHHCAGAGLCLHLTHQDIPIALDDEFDDYAWCDRDEATGRLIFAGQRWAVRHIEDIVANPVADSDFYRLP